MTFDVKGCAIGGPIAGRTGNGDGTFGAPVNFSQGVLGDTLLVGDLNGDKKLDLAFSNSQENPRSRATVTPSGGSAVTSTLTIDYSSRLQARPRFRSLKCSVDSRRNAGVSRSAWRLPWLQQRHSAGMVGYGPSRCYFYWRPDGSRYLGAEEEEE